MSSTYPAFLQVVLPNHRSFHVGERRRVSRRDLGFCLALLLNRGFLARCPKLVQMTHVAATV